MSQSYTNPLGVTLGQCSFCGFCERFGCGNYAKSSAQCISGVLMKLPDTVLNPFIAGGAIGMVLDDFNGDKFDHSGLGFVAGRSLAASSTGGRPIQQIGACVDDPKWGSGWKQAMKENDQSVYGVGVQRSVYSDKDANLDLDPTYKDLYGSPLLRMTFDWHRRRAGSGVRRAIMRSTKSYTLRAAGALAPPGARSTGGEGSLPAGRPVPVSVML